jgi:hypothetical protein
MLVFRKLNKRLIRKCIKNPSRILPARAGRKIYLKDLGKNFLKLVVSEEGSNLVIITAYWLEKKRAKM